MIDTEFEKKSRDHTDGMPVVDGFWFATWSPGFSNLDEIRDWRDPDFDRKYLKYLRECEALQ
jgi:hypothetical protein